MDLLKHLELRTFMSGNKKIVNTIKKMTSSAGQGAWFTLPPKLLVGGFTLAELLVAGGILVIIIGITLGIYFPSFRAQKRSVAYSRIQQETQIVLEIMAKEIRSKEIWYDYGKYGGTVNQDGEAHLALKDANNNYVIFCAQAGQVYQYRAANPIPPPSDCAGDPAVNFAPISAMDITITNLEFFIKPSQDPYPQGAPDLRQPRVTIVIQAQKMDGSTVISTHFQTTIPQRFTQKR